ncbi:MAG: hypothetical protein AAGL98_12960, partial [Planctomycetota bacterium]
MSKSIRPYFTFVFTAAFLGLAMPSAVGQPGGDEDRPARHAERDRDLDRGGYDDLREPRDPEIPGDFVPPLPPDGEERPGRRPPMTDPEIQAARQIIARLYPELALRMDTLHAENPQKLRRTIERRFPRVRFLVKLQKRQPALFALRMDDIRLGRETFALAKQVQQAHLNDDKEAYKDLYATLEEKLAAHFDVKQRVRQAEL